MKTPTTKPNSDRLQTKLVARRPIPKGYGDALHTGWRAFGRIVTDRHRAFFELRDMPVPTPHQFEFGKGSKRKKPCQSAQKTETDTQPTGSSAATSSDSFEQGVSASGARPNTESLTPSQEAK